MPGKRIKDLTALSGAGSANDDDVVIFDTTANETKRISRSQLAEGMQADVQVLTNKTIALGSNTVTGTTAQFNTALTDNNFATQAGAEALSNKTIDSANNTLTINYKEAQVETSNGSRTHLFTTVAALLADTGTYTTYTAGQIVEAGGFRYTVAATGATDHHVITAGSVKLYVQAGDAGYNVKAFGAVGDGVADDTVEIQAAINALPKRIGTLKYGRVVLPVGRYLVSDTIAFSTVQSGELVGEGAEIFGSIDKPILRFGGILAGCNWSNIHGLFIQNNATSSNARAFSVVQCYSCNVYDMRLVGGSVCMDVDGNCNKFTNVSVKTATSIGVQMNNSVENQVNTFVSCAFEDCPTGMDATTLNNPAGSTHLFGCYFEDNSSKAFAASNTARFTILDTYFNLGLHNNSVGVDLSGTVGPRYPTTGLELDAANEFTSGGWGFISNNSIGTGSATGIKFISESSAASSNVVYDQNRLFGGTCDMYGSAPKSINLDRRRKAPYVRNAVDFTITTPGTPPDGWTGTGTVPKVSGFSPYGAGSGIQISNTVQYIYQTIKVPSNALIRVSVWAKSSGALAECSLQAWSAGLGANYTTSSSTNTSADFLEIFIPATLRSSATSFELLLRNIGTGDFAEFCDLEIEDLTN